MRALISATLAISLAAACGTQQPRAAVDSPDAWAAQPEQYGTPIGGTLIVHRAPIAEVAAAEAHDWEVTEGHVTIVNHGDGQ